MFRISPLSVLFAGCLVVSAWAADLSREIILTPQAGAEQEDAEIRRWQTRVGAPAAKAEDYERLGWAFVAKARRSLDAGYYKLAEKTVDAMETACGASPESRLLRGHVLDNLHRFHEAEAIARQLVAERGQAEDYALLSDALMEQGRLADSVAALQHMVDLKPGPEAYSRIAHLRWLKGDLAGATQAMEMAGRATSPLDGETTAWIMARLSGYYLQAGRTQAALNAAEVALRHASAYPPALLARGRAALALGKNVEGLGALKLAAGLNPLPEYQWWLADAQRATGHADEAQVTETALRARGEVSDPRTFALFLATRDEDPAQAVRLARAELENRGDVFSHDALAWALAASGDWPAAAAEMKAALAEGTRDARLLLHAGEIAAARGEKDAAARYFAEARPLAAGLTPSERARLTARAPGDALATTVAQAH